MKLKQIIFGSIVLLSLGCGIITDGDCEIDYDYSVPPLITSPIYLGPNFFDFAEMNGTRFPQGTQLYYLGGENLFFTLVRSDGQGNLIKFYWTSNFPAPFSRNGAPPYDSLRIGETLELNIFVRNDAFPDLDCINNNPPESSAILQTTINIENGSVVERDAFREIPSVPPQESRIITYPFEYIGRGEYEVRFIIPFDIDELETDTTNNVISREIQFD